MHSLSYLFLSVLFSTSTLAASPPSLQILNTRVLDCTYNISSQLSPSPSAPNASNSTTIDILFDTSASPNGTPDALAWTDSGDDSYGSLCTVCVEVGLSSEEKRTLANGTIVSLDYDFWHKLDPGLLEQVTSHVRRPRDAGEEWFETSYIYGSTETQSLQRVQANIALASDPLVLGLARNVSETICVETSFAVYNRIGVEGARGEISRRSVFRLGVNVEWEG